MSARAARAELAAHVEHVIADLPGVTGLYMPGPAAAAAAAFRVGSDRHGTVATVREEAGGALHLELGIGVTDQKSALDIVRAAYAAADAALVDLGVTEATVRITVVRIG